MPQFGHRSLIAFSGALWLFAGILLVTLGVRLFLGELHALQPSPHLSLLPFFRRATGDSKDLPLFLITAALLVGYLKAKLVLGKAVRRQVTRISNFPPKTSLKHLYSKGYYLILAGMMALGFLMRHLPIAPDLRGLIDLAIGSALLQGALLFFRHATTSYAKDV